MRLDDDDVAAAAAVAFTTLVRGARALARRDQSSSVRFASGLEAFRAAGATDPELYEYSLERQVIMLEQIAKASGVVVAGRGLTASPAYDDAPLETVN